MSAHGNGKNTNPLVVCAMKEAIKVVHYPMVKYVSPTEVNSPQKVGTMQFVFGNNQLIINFDELDTQYMNGIKSIVNRNYNATYVSYVTKNNELTDTHNTLRNTYTIFNINYLVTLHKEVEVGRKSIINALMVQNESDGEHRITHRLSRRDASMENNKIEYNYDIFMK